MAKKIVTLYIDDANIRLLVAHGKRIKKVAELPLEMRRAKVSDAIKNAEISTKLKELLKSQKVHTKKIIVGLSGLRCLTRPMILPQLPKAMLEEAVTREAKRLLPVSLEQLYLSWQALPATEGKTQVFLSAIPHELADNLLAILHQAGLKPYLMDLKPLAIARMSPEENAIITDVQPTELDIVIMTKGVPQPVRTIAFPNKALSPQEKLSTVKEELDRTIQFHNSNNPENPIATDTNIFISGELAGNPELCETLANELGHPVLPLPSPLQNPSQLDLTHYMVNIGLALKELGKQSGSSAVNLNTLPTPYRPKPISIPRIVALPSAIIVISLLALQAMMVQDASVNIATIQEQLDTTNEFLKKNLAQKTELASSIAELENNIAGAEASCNTLTIARSNFDGKGNIINGDLEETVDNLFGSTALTGVSHSGSILSLQGSASDEKEILAYARRLDLSGRFSEVTVSSISKDSNGEGMNFTLALQIAEEGKD